MASQHRDKSGLEIEFNRQSAWLVCMELWVPSPELYKPSVVCRSILQPVGERRQEGQKFKVKLRYIVSSRQA